MIPRYTEELGTVVPDADGKYVTYEDHDKSEAKAENAAAKRAYLKFLPIVDDLRRKLGKAATVLHNALQGYVTDHVMRSVIETTLAEIAELAEARHIIPLDDDTECDIRLEERRRIVEKVDVWAGPGAWLFCLKRNLLAAIEETTP
ncbi:hypothetical protein LCGC14_1811460 [marine sediment metagenome]|uniref:Uncharacterized protein n=1 Tax=marine sediment metagenome TaxID=412755 RepID=A0A0F9GLP6_9ZZZZ